MTWNYLTTRARLILLIIAAALPALGLSVYHDLERRSEAEANAHEDLERFAALAVQQQDEGIESVRQLLLALSAPALVRWPEACSGFFKGTISVYKWVADTRFRYSGPRLKS